MVKFILFGQNMYPTGMNHESIPRGVDHLVDIPYGKEFAAHADELVASLCDRIGVDYSKLECDEAGLRQMDEALSSIYPCLPDDYKYGEDEIIVVPPPELLGEVTALIGKVLIRSTTGRWEMVHVKQNPSVYEPIVVGSDGQRFHFADKIAHCLIMDYCVELDSVYFLSLHHYLKGRPDFI